MERELGSAALAVDPHVYDPPAKNVRTFNLACVTCGLGPYATIHVTRYELAAAELEARAREIGS